MVLLSKVRVDGLLVVIMIAMMVAMTTVVVMIAGANVGGGDDGSGGDGSGGHGADVSVMMVLLMVIRVRYNSENFCLTLCQTTPCFGQT
jgi:hypothetical protein